MHVLITESKQGNMNRKRSVKPSKKNAVSAGTVQDLPPISLPSPRFDHGESVFTALKKRRTVRAVRGKKLPLQMLSNLLWAACGVNRKNGPFGVLGRTAASASNSQEIDLYVALQEGIYLYKAALAKKLKLRSDQHALFGQTVGYPGKD